MRKKYLLLSSVGLLATGALLAINAFSGVSFSIARGSSNWNHYEAVAPTCGSYGIKEYWTDCKGNTTIEEPVGAEIDEKGQPSAADIQYIVDTYGADDERIIAKSDVHGSGVESTECLGKEVCSVCGETLGSIIPTINFTSNLYGAYDVYPSWGSYAQDGWTRADNAGQISFVSYENDAVSEYHLPRIYFAGFESLTIDVTVACNLVKYSLDSEFTTSFQVSKASYPLKVVFDSITSSSMSVKILDESNNVQVQATCSDTDVLNGDDNFVIYVKGSGPVGWDAFSNFQFTASHVHNFVADSNCIGREVCSICSEARGVASPSFDFTSNLYGACDVYPSWGSYAQDGWTRADNAGQISFVSYENDAVSEYHLPRIYFAGFESLTIDVTVACNLVKYSLDSEFTTSFQVSKASYPLKVVFDSITSSSMSVKILDESNNVQVQATCSDADVLNGDDNFVIYVKGSGPVGWDAFSNFTFVA